MKNFSTLGIFFLVKVLLLLTVFPVISEAGFLTKKHLNSTHVGYIQTGFNYASAFSPDSRLLALLQYRYSKEKQKNVATLKIWGTDKVKLLYSSKPFYFSHLDYTHIVFANQNRIVSRNSVERSLFSWDFTKTDEVEHACTEAFDPEAKQPVENNGQPYVLASGDGMTSLCQLGNKATILAYYNSDISYWRKDSKSILLDDSILVISGLKKEIPQMRSSNLEWSERFSSWMNEWNIGLHSEANKLISLFDKEKYIFMIFELFNDEVVINQWNYKNREFLGQQSLTDIKVKNVYLSKNYILLKSENNFSLFERKENKLVLAWRKSYDQVDFDSSYQIMFGKNEDYIVLYNSSIDPDDRVPPVILFNIKDGAMQFYPPTVVIKGFIQVDPKLYYFTNTSLLKNTCPMNFNGYWYGLKENKAIKDVEAVIFDLSPNGDFALACKNEALLLMNMRE